MKSLYIENVLRRKFSRNEENEECLLIGKRWKMIRRAEEKDISRIAEILIFTKRMTYRPIFRDDKVSFGEMQVLPLAEEYRKHPERLNHMWVYEEEFAKGLITLRLGKNRETLQIEELYVDVFFHNEGIGRKFLAFAEAMAKEQGMTELSLWVLEKNEHARFFYEKNGFRAAAEREKEEGTEEYLIKYRKGLEKEAEKD